MTRVLAEAVRSPSIVIFALAKRHFETHEGPGTENGKSSVAVDALRLAEKDWSSMCLRPRFRHLAKRNAFEARSLVYRVVALYRVLLHPQVPLSARVIAVLSVANVFSPIQMIPSVIPVIGQLDDLLVLFCSVRLLRQIVPKEILEECQTSYSRRMLFR
jgi:uncharacterized membrane protein YkvA (DUF1232 family)